jgi:phage gpG-like protein
MLSINTAGFDELDARLTAFPDRILAALDKTSNQLAQALLDKVQSGNLAGGILNSRTGALAASISADVTTSAERVTASLTSIGVPYAAIQEFGGRTSPHEIVPSKAQALAFLVGGETRFARRVHHPGSNIPERSFLRSTLAEFTAEIETQLGAAANDAWRDA